MRMRNLSMRALHNGKTPPRFRVTGFITQGGLHEYLIYADAEVVVVGVGIDGALPIPPLGP